MKVKAIKLGHFNHKRIQEGEIFDMPSEIYFKNKKDDKGGVCSWVELVDEKKPAPAPKKKVEEEKPKAFSQLQKGK